MFFDPTDGAGSEISGNSSGLKPQVLSAAGDRRMLHPTVEQVPNRSIQDNAVNRNYCSSCSPLRDFFP
jgi:hypothetical protein